MAARRNIFEVFKVCNDNRNYEYLVLGQLNFMILFVQQKYSVCWGGEEPHPNPIYACLFTCIPP
jgi:hypothetical protein